MSSKRIALISVLVLAPVLYFSWINIDEGNELSIPAPQAMASVDASLKTPMPLIAVPENKKPVATLPVITALSEPSLPVNPIERIRAIQEKTEMHRAMLKDYDEFKRYPGNNQRIAAPDQDPLIKGYQVDERTTVSEDKNNALTIWSDKKYYLRGEQVLVSAYVTDDTGTRIPVNLAAQLIFNERESIQALEFEDKDQDAVYELNFIADEIDETSLQAGIYKVLIVSDTNELIDSVAFVLADPEAAFTGNYRDSVTPEGNLSIEAEVEVTLSDRFYFQASLYTELGEPIGGTQVTLNLDKGKNWVPMEFYGLMLHDSMVDGPYLLRNIALARVTMPMQRAPLTHPEYYTAAYPLSKFSNTNYAEVVSLK